MKEINLTVPTELQETRIDIALVEMLKSEDPPMSRRKIRRIIDVGGVYLNGKRIRVASREVQAGASLKIIYDENVLKSVAKPEVDLKYEDIIFEDEAIVVVNKPPGLVTQPTQTQAVVHLAKSVEAILGLSKNQLWLVHRLDKETSGCVVLAKSKKVMNQLTTQFKERQIIKTYEAMCNGKAPKTFEVKNQLSAISPHTGKVCSVKSGGRIAETKFKTLRTTQVNGNDFSLIQCHPKTGRTHQLRVHLSEHDLPIVGDKKYDDGRGSSLPDELKEISLRHHLLHASRLEFRHPLSNMPMQFDAPRPPAMHEFLRKLGL